MKKNLFFGAALLAGVVFSSGYVLGQQGQTLTSAQQKFFNLTTDLDTNGGPENYSALATEYLKAPNDSAVAQQIIRMAQVSRDKNSAVVSLLSLQVAQNQKIIELLKASAAKTK